MSGAGWEWWIPFLMMLFAACNLFAYASGFSDCEELEHGD